MSIKKCALRYSLSSSENLISIWKVTQQKFQVVRSYRKHAVYNIRNWFFFFLYVYALEIGKSLYLWVHFPDNSDTSFPCRLSSAPSTDNVCRRWPDPLALVCSVSSFRYRILCRTRSTVPTPTSRNRSLENVNLKIINKHTFIWIII